jgi:hypothetical protein
VRILLVDKGEFIRDGSGGEWGEAEFQIKGCVCGLGCMTYWFLVLPKPNTASIEAASATFDCGFPQY